MSSNESAEEEPSPRIPRREAGSSARRNLDHLNDGFFEESTSSSEDDGIDFKADSLDFSCSGSDDDNESDSKLRNEEDKNTYDKNLMDKLSSKQLITSDVEDDEEVTSRVKEYMKKMRAEEKTMLNKLNDGSASSEKVSKNRMNKDAILKKFGYKDQLEKLKNESFFDRYDSSDSSGTEDDSDFVALAETMEKMNTGMTTGSKPSTLKSSMKKTTKPANSREMDIRQKIAEMKKMIESPNDELDEKILKSKQKVSDWMKDETTKSAALKEKFISSKKIVEETLKKDLAARKPSKLSDVKSSTKAVNSRFSLPPVKSTKPFGDTLKSTKKDDILQHMYDAGSPSKLKSQNPEKPPIPKKKIAAVSKVDTGLPARLLQTKLEASKIMGKIEPPHHDVPSPTMNRLAARKPVLKKPTIKKTTAT